MRSRITPAATSWSSTISDSRRCRNSFAVLGWHVAQAPVTLTAFDGDSVRNERSAVPSVPTRVELAPAAVLGAPVHSARPARVVAKLSAAPGPLSIERAGMIGMTPAVRRQQRHDHRLRDSSDALASSTSSRAATSRDRPYRPAGGVVPSKAVCVPMAPTVSSRSFGAAEFGVARGRCVRTPQQRGRLPRRQSACNALRARRSCSRTRVWRT